MAKIRMGGKSMKAVEVIEDYVDLRHLLNITI